MMKMIYQYPFYIEPILLEELWYKERKRLIGHNVIFFCLARQDKYEAYNVQIFKNYSNFSKIQKIDFHLDS